MNKRKKKSRTRIVCYAYHKPDGDGYSVQDIFNETDMEKLLENARQEGIVTQYDTGRGAIVWFEGQPGVKLRKLRKTVLDLLPPDVKERK
jgi:hypothetical protein